MASAIKYILTEAKILDTLLYMAVQTLDGMPKWCIILAIYGIVLLLIALGTGLVKTPQVKDVSGFLISIMPLLYVPPAVRILEYWGIIGSSMATIVIITVLTTFLVFAVSGLVTQWIMKRKGGKDNG